MHLCFLIKGPPNLGLSKQYMHLPQSSARHVAHFPQLHTFFPTVTFTGLGVDDLSLLARSVASFFSNIEGSSLPELNETVMVDISLL